MLFIEVSGCLPMCGQGTIGTVTMALEQGLVTPREPGVLNLDTPAGRVVAAYEREGRFVERVRLTNEFSAVEVLRLSPLLRRAVNAAVELAHPEDPTIKGVSHVQRTGQPRGKRAHARNAVFYGDKGIHRSPCGTGTSARMAQLAARGKLKPGDAFIHESIIGSEFEGRIETATELAGQPAIVPPVAGWARMAGLNTIFVDERDPYWRGFRVT